MEAKRPRACRIKRGERCDCFEPCTLPLAEKPDPKETHGLQRKRLVAREKYLMGLPYGTKLVTGEHRVGHPETHVHPLSVANSQRCEHTRPRTGAAAKGDPARRGRTETQHSAGQNKDEAGALPLASDAAVPSPLARSHDGSLPTDLPSIVFCGWAG